MNTTVFIFECKLNAFALQIHFVGSDSLKDLLYEPSRSQLACLSDRYMFIGLFKSRKGDVPCGCSVVAGY